MAGWHMAKGKGYDKPMNLATIVTQTQHRAVLALIALIVFVVAAAARQ